MQIEASSSTARPIASSSFRALAVLVSERIDVRSLTSATVLATNPLTIARASGVVVLYRHGIAVFFDVAQSSQQAFLQELMPLLINPYPTPETESLDIRIDAQAREGVTSGVATLEDGAVERLQIVADVLGKSVLLALYERNVAGEFDRIEPLAAELDRTGRVHSKSRELLKKLGSMLLVEQRMVGRAEIADKPEVLWEHPQLEGLFVRLQDEFEIEERHTALERKLKLISQTAHMVLELLGSKHSLRVEWYIVMLIILEILLTLYQLFLR